MRALLEKYVGASRLSTRLLSFWRLLLVGPIIVCEIFFTTALFDFYLPAELFPFGRTPSFIPTRSPRGSCSRRCCWHSWRGRNARKIGSRYTAAGADGLGVALALNITLFATLLGCKFLLSSASQPTFGLLVSYSLVFLATGSAMALALAPLTFWRGFIKLARVEILVAVAVALVVMVAAALAQSGWGLDIARDAYARTLVPPPL